MKSRASTSRSLETEREKRLVGGTRIQGNTGTEDAVGGKRERERDMGEKGGKRVRRREKGTSAKFLPNWGGTTTSTTTTTTTAANLG